MAVEIACGNCGNTFGVEAEWANLIVQCPFCSAAVQVPAEVANWVAAVSADPLPPVHEPVPEPEPPALSASPAQAPGTLDWQAIAPAAPSSKSQAPDFSNLTVGGPATPDQTPIPTPPTKPAKTTASVAAPEPSSAPTSQPTPKPARQPAAPPATPTTASTSSADRPQRNKADTGHVKSRGPSPPDLVGSGVAPVPSDDPLADTPIVTPTAAPTPSTAPTPPVPPWSVPPSCGWLAERGLESLRVVVNEGTTTIRYQGQRVVLRAEPDATHWYGLSSFVLSIITLVVLLTWLYFVYR